LLTKHVSSKVDRQQTRIRGLIEEQDTKVDEERTLIERRAQDQLRQAREEAEAQAGSVFFEAPRLFPELEGILINWINYLFKKYFETSPC